MTSPYAAGSRAISRDGTIGFATVAFDQRANVLPAAAAKRVIAAATAARSASLQVELGGQAIEQAQQASIGYTALVGIGAAVVVLLISFGSMLAMGLPIVTALFGLGTGLGLIGLLSRVLSMPDFSSELALMIGLGVGIDYALFIVTRYREAYRRNGGDVRGAVEEAMNTAGRAVIFAGTTVVIALMGMFALGVSFLYGLAIASSVAVLLVLAASLTLLPALLTFFGRRIGKPGVLAPPAATAPQPGPERLLDALDRGDPAPAVARVHRLGRVHARARLPGARPAARQHRRRQRPEEPDDAQGLRPARAGVRQGVQRAAARRRQAAPARGQRPRSGSSPRRSRRHRGVAAVAHAAAEPDGDVATISAFPTTSPQSSTDRDASSSTSATT